MAPSIKTTIWSASRTVEVRCEIRIVVRPSMISRSPVRMRSSVCVSTLESESSRIRIRGSRIAARAIAARCFCPPERVMPRSPNALFFVVRESEGDVAADGFAEQVGVLRDEADGLAQGGERPFADRAPIDQDRVVRRFPEARDEGGKRGLAAARGADDGERRAGGDFQIDVVEYRMRAAAVG